MTTRSPSNSQDATPPSERLAGPERQTEAQAWLEQNRRAITAFNKRVERDGIWSDGLRKY